MSKKRLQTMPGKRGSAGFTLVELMVGVGVGLLSTVVIATILARSEQQKRNTMSGSDAQVAGALALFELEKEVKEAGYGLTSDTAGTGCTLTAKYAGAVIADIPPDLAPIVITKTADMPDTLRITKSMPTRFSIPAQVTAPLFNPTGGGSVANTVTLKSNIGIEPGDLLAVVSAPADPTTGVGSCIVFQATDIKADHVGVGRTVDAEWNSIATLPAMSLSQYVVNLGALESSTYSVAPVAAGSPIYALQRAQFTLKDRAVVNRVVQNGVVDLKAFYGVDTDADGVVDQYVSDTPTTVAGWQQVRAVRMALLTRSEQFEKDKVTTAEPLWDVGKLASVPGTEDCGTSKCIKLNPKVAADWEHYRYKVFEVVIPIRNQLWRSDLGT